MAAGQPPDYYKTDLMASTPGEGARAGVNMLNAPTGASVPGPGGGEEAIGDQQFQNQMNRPNRSIMAPLMNSYGMEEEPSYV